MSEKRLSLVGEGGVEEKEAKRLFFGMNLAVIWWFLVFKLVSFDLFFMRES